jgi:hypothetical protein
LSADRVVEGQAGEKDDAPAEGREEDEDRRAGRRTGEAKSKPTRQVC